VGGQRGWTDQEEAGRFLQCLDLITSSKRLDARTSEVERTPRPVAQPLMPTYGGLCWTAHFVGVHSSLRHRNVANDDFKSGIFRTLMLL
jgi:hypothetical protein